MSRQDIDESNCPVTAALTLIGDRWTLLILKEIAVGVHRFEEIQAQIGASPFLLSSRLKRLHEIGIIERIAYNAHPPRYEYYPTEKGRSIDPIIISFFAWGVEWARPGKIMDGLRLTDARTGDLVNTHSCIPMADMRLGEGLIESHMSAAYAAERISKRTAFFNTRRAQKKN